MIPEILQERLRMKRTLLAIVTLGFVLTGLAVAQSADEEYLKAMQLSDNCQKAKALEAYLGKYAGQGTTNEHWAYAYYCLTPCASTDAQKAAEAGEKALATSGIDGQTKLQLLATIPTLYNKAGQGAKADAAAHKLIDFGKGQSDAKLASQLQAGGYAMIGQFAEKAGDYGKAAENYIKAYGIYKDPSISKQLNGLAATLYKGGKFAEAEQVFRQFYASDKGPESASLLAQTLYKQNKVDEALAVYKEAYAAKKTGALAKNIATILNTQVKTDPSKTTEAVNALIEAAILNPKETKAYTDAAKFTKTYNAKIEGKSEEDLSAADKRVIQTLEANIESEKAAIAKIQAGQKSVLDKFNALYAQIKTRLGK